MKISELTLDFLWLKREHIILDAPDPFDEKWRDFRLEFRDFIASCSIIELIELITFCYKDKYCRDYWFGSLFNSDFSTSEIKTDEKGITKVPNKYLERKDILLYSEKIKNGKEDMDYLSEITLEFNKEYNLQEAIEKGLEGKEYEKKNNINSLLFIVEDSPIKKLEITNKSFYIEFKEDDFIHYAG